MTGVDGWNRVNAVLLLWAAMVINSSAQSFTTLASFDGKDGAAPEYMSLIEAVDGNLYGTTTYGGTYNLGTVIRITTGGTVSTLHSFAGPDGFTPYAGLVQGTDGNLYGTTSYGGANNYGTVFQITLGGALTTLHSFVGTDGAYPYAGLVEGTDGNFYGTTYEGGANDNRGTIYQITTSGQLTTLYNFCAQTACADGYFPTTSLVQAVNGNFYGTVGLGGANSAGTVFELTPSGQLTTLYNFCSLAGCTDGAYPTGLIQAGGNFFGTTSGGGIECSSYGAQTCGTAFEVTPAGVLTTLYSFCSQPDCSDGALPAVGLLQGSDGNFYGTTSYGGANGFGSVYEINAGTLTTLHSFDETDGAYPTGLVQATNGDFYGTTTAGGTKRVGTAFSLSVGLGSFLKTLPGFARVGDEVGILGTQLTSASSVKFNGIAAPFRVFLPSLILTHVPAGASTGKISVTVPREILSTHLPFHIVTKAPGPAAVSP
jgi:uncharacterized repeat protein (TIGR03803 family)